MSVRNTLPYDKDGAKILQDEAKRQGRSFSGFLQIILNEHIESTENAEGATIPEKSEKKIKKKKRIRKRK